MHIKFIHSHEPNFSITWGEGKQGRKTTAERAVLGDDVVENEDWDWERKIVVTVSSAPPSQV